MLRVATFIVIFSMYTFGWSQDLMDQPVTFSYENKTINDVLLQLEEETTLRFSFNPDRLPTDPISGKYNEVTVQDFLDEILGSGYQYKTRGSYIILQSTGARDPGRKQKFDISGEIVDANTGEKIPYTTIYEVDRLTASLTDPSGSFDMSFASKQEIAYIAISKENYQDTVIRVDKSNPFPKLLKLKPINFNFKVKNDKPESEKRTNGITEKSTLASLFISKKNRENDRNVDLEESRLFQLSLVPGLSTNGQLNGKVTNRYSLNMIAGYTKAINGAELGGVANIVREDITGVQIGGFSNIIGGETKGAQIAGFINTNKGKVSGLQMAGFLNTSTGNTGGSQIGGFMNYGKNITGLQMSGFLNIGKDVKGAGISGFSNVSKQSSGTLVAGFSNHSSSVKGAHISGFINTSADLSGFQLAGFMNVSGGQMRGMQLSGFLNKADTVRGVQFGVINFARRVEKGAAIGFVNIVKDGLKKWEISGNDLTVFHASFRSGTKKFHSILSAGIQPGKEAIWSYGAGFGHQIDLKGNWYLGFDLTSNVLQPIDVYLEDLSLDNRFRINVGYELGERISLNTGPVVHYFLSTRESGTHKYFPELIGENAFIKSEGAGTIHRVWLGYHFTLRI